MDRFRFTVPSVALTLTIVALGALATIGLMAMGPSRAGAAPQPCADYAPSIRVDLASSILSQVPVGTNVTHKVRVKTGICPVTAYASDTLEFTPPSGQTLVTTGNTGAWSCTANADQSLTCTRPTMPSALTSTLTLTYQQGPYQDGGSRASACISSTSPPLEHCNTAWSKSLP